MNSVPRTSRLRAFLAAIGVAGLVTACGGGGGGSTPTSPTPAPAPGALTLTVEVRDFEFSPRSILVHPGDTVTWRLVGSDHTHSVTAIGGIFDSGFVFTAPGSTFTRTFTDADLGKTYEYRCTTHYVTHMMQGSVRVGDSSPAPSPGY